MTRQHPTLAAFDRLAGELYEALCINDELAANFILVRAQLAQELASARAETRRLKEQLEHADRPA